LLGKAGKDKPPFLAVLFCKDEVCGLGKGATAEADPCAGNS
jgi:hypothetical protein